MTSIFHICSDNFIVSCITRISPSYVLERQGRVEVSFKRKSRNLTKLQFNRMNTFQQTYATKFHPEDKDDVATQAQTFLGEENQSIFETLKEQLPFLKQEFLRHQEIYAKISKGTFSSDKILRLLSAVLKIIRNFKMMKNLKPIQNLSAQIGQMRRLLRYDRVLMIVKEYIGFARKGRLTKMDKFMLFFKLMIIFGDFNDIISFFMQVKILSNDQLLRKLRTNVANIYFLECLGWLSYHLYEYSKSHDEETKEKNKTMCLKYLLDTFISHNDFTLRLFTLNPNLIALVGLASSVLNLSLVWK